MLPSFTFIRCRFYLEALDTLEATTHWGNALRGMLGGVWKRSVCTVAPGTLEGDCQACRVRSDCTYGSVFESVPPADTEVLRKIRDIPRPYALALDVSFMRPVIEAGSVVAFDLTLVGDGAEALSDICRVFERAGESGMPGVGLGKGRGRIRLRFAASVDLDGRERDIVYRPGDQKAASPDPMTWMDMEEWATARLNGAHQLTMTLLSPLVLLQSVGNSKARRSLAHPNAFRRTAFRDILRAVIRVSSALAYFNCGRKKMGDEAVHDMLDGCEKKMRTHIEELDVLSVSRHRRSRGTMQAPFGEMYTTEGYIGRLTFEGDLNKYAPLLALGQYLNIGKQRTVGLGAYKLSVGAES